LFQLLQSLDKELNPIFELNIVAFYIYYYLRCLATVHSDLQGKVEQK